MTDDIQQKIDALVKNHPIVLFMKGNASFPMCGFSGRAIQLLKTAGADPKMVYTVNVLEDEAIRQGIKVYSNWPTIPQLYVHGEFIGGSDIMQEMHEKGELQEEGFWENGIRTRKNPLELSDETLASATEKLNKLIGLESVKQDILQLISYIKVKRIREEKGISQLQLAMAIGHKAVGVISNCE